jgi:tetratricopeptide (TPR) repeat protein
LKESRTVAWLGCVASSWARLRCCQSIVRTRLGQYSRPLFLAGYLTVFALSFPGCGPRHGLASDKFSVDPSGFPALSCPAESTSATRSSRLAAVEQDVLGGKETHTYSVLLAQGELLQVLADQAKADLMLCLYSPERKLLLGVDSPNGQDEPEEILWEAYEKGSYDLAVHRLAEEGAAPRSYDLTVHRKPRANEADSKRLAGLIAMARAEELRRSHRHEDWPTARQEYLRALELWKRMGDLGRVADLEARLGRLDRERLGDLAGASEAYGRARSLFARLGNRKQEARALNSLGQIAMESGRLEEALGSQKRALELFAATGDRRGEAVSLHEIGYLYDLFGEAHRALDAYSRSLERWAGLEDRAEKATTLHNRGILYYSLGEYTAALDDLEEARALRTGTTSELASTLTWIGLTHASAGRLKEALPILEHALALRVASGNRRGEAATETVLGWILQRLGRRAEGLKRYQHAFEIYVGLADARDRARAYLNLGRALREVGRLHEAVPLLQTALDGGRKE